MIELTVEALKATKMKGPTRFGDGARGMAFQDFESVDEPRFGYRWHRDHRKDPGRQFYTVDWEEVASLEEAIEKLSKPADPGSQREVWRQFAEETKDSPRMNVGACSALNEARCNASAGPFGMVRAFLRRAENAWHGGINAYADAIRNAGGDRADHPDWLYNAKSAAQEMHRGQYLFAALREKETGLKCALGVQCSKCPILKTIEETMVVRREKSGFPTDINDHDIDAAKVLTCIGHVLQEKAGKYICDGAFWYRPEDRE